MAAHTRKATEADFAEYIRARRDRLVRAAYLLTGDLHQAEDLVQTTLIRVWPRWSRISEMEHVDAYVHRTLVSVFSTGLRRRRWREVPGDRHWDEPPGAPLVPDHAAAVTDRSDLRAVLGSLGPRQRAVLVLRYYLDLSETETAELLGCSVGTVKSQASKAVRRIKDQRARDPRPAEGGTP